MGRAQRINRNGMIDRALSNEKPNDLRGMADAVSAEAEERKLQERTRDTGSKFLPAGDCRQARGFVSAHE